MCRHSRSRNHTDNGNRCVGQDRLGEPYPPKNLISPAFAQFTFIFQKHEVSI